MYALCVSGAVNTQGFVWKFFYALYINFHSFIHSLSFLGEQAAYSCYSPMAEGIPTVANKRVKTEQRKQQRPESPTVTLTWHASKYKVHKLEIEQI